MRLWRALIISMAVGLMLSACATVPKSGQPQPADHFKAEAGHLTYAFLGALHENEREILGAYMDARILYLDAKRQQPEPIEAAAVIESLSAADTAGAEKSLVRILTRKELKELGAEAPDCMKKLRDYLKDGDILVTVGAAPQKADESDQDESMLLAFRRIDKKILLVAAAVN